MKCADSWVFFNKMAVSPYGNKSASELVKLVFKAPTSKLMQDENGAEVKFNLL